MKCGAPMPGGSYQTCDRDLKPSGQHSSFNDRWSRPEPAAPAYDVWELLDDTAPRNAWGLQERSFPIIVTETITRVLWVEAENEDQALDYWADDWTDIPLKSADVIDGDLEFERPDEFQRQEAFKANRFEQKIGPLLQCPDCGKDSFRQTWFHNPYRKCHGPIVWKTNGIGRPMREYQQTPVHSAARTEVAA
jgi:hypothetical protein